MSATEDGIVLPPVRTCFRVLKRISWAADSYAVLALKNSRGEELPVAMNINNLRAVRFGENGLPPEKWSSLK